LDSKLEVGGRRIQRKVKIKLDDPFQDERQMHGPQRRFMSVKPWLSYTKREENAFRRWIRTWVSI